MRLCALALVLLATLLAVGAAGADSRTPAPKAVRSGLGDEPAAQAPSPFGLLSPRRLDDLKAGIAVAGALLLLWGAVLERAGRPDAERRLRDAALLGLGVLALACWWNLGRFHFPHYPHRSDSYVYFVGAKYFRELGHQNLYRCTAVAEAEAGAGDALAERPMRDLASNRLGRAGEALADPDACRRLFGDARWEAFRRDVEWFRAYIPPRQWRRAQMDHGYNATPVWGILGIALANSGPASEARILALALLDPLLLAVMWSAVVWAFGWRAACVAALFWGTNPFAHYGWVGGGILRQDWLLATVLSVCLLRRGRPGAAGFALASAALLRVFPGLIFVALGLQAVLGMLGERRWRPTPEHTRLAAGALLAGAVLLPLSMVVAGPRAWADFAANSRLHLDTPLRNSLGLATAVAYEPGASFDALYEPGADDPHARWKESRLQSFEGRRPLFYALLAGYLALLARAVRGREPWVAGVLGVGLIPMATELTCYYQSVLLAFGLLWTRQRDAGIALCLLSAVGWAITSRWHAPEHAFALSSAAAALFVVYVTARFAWGDARGRAPFPAG